jgi:hypothetical protein
MIKQRRRQEGIIANLFLNIIADPLITTQRKK